MVIPVRRRPGALPIVAALIAMVASTAPSFAQGEPRTWELGVQLGAAGDSRNPGWFGARFRGAAQQALTASAALDLVRIGPAAIRYVAHVEPLVRLGDVEHHASLGTLDLADGDPASLFRLYAVGGRTTVWGAALVPFGLALDARLHSRFRLQAASGLGIAAFTRHVPSAAARQRNFIAQLEASALVRLDATRWLEAGVRWRHLSNGNTAWENPGLDSRLVVLGLRWQRASGR